MKHIDYSLYRRLKNALETLTTGQGDVRQRLKDSYNHIMPLHESDFPLHLQSERTAIIQSITKYSSKDVKKSNLDKFTESLDKDHYESLLGGSVNITMGKIKNKTGTKIASRIFSLFRDLHDFYFANET